jgi:hypothetical protein
LIINKVGDDDVVLKGASNPFKYLDLIESFKKEKEGATEDDKFGMIMDALE